MTTEEKQAEELIDKFRDLIAATDFHVPEFITGISCSDGSEEYSKILKLETDNLAVACAIVHVEGAIENQKQFYIEHYSNTIDFDITKAYSENIRRYQSILSILKNK